MPPRFEVVPNQAVPPPVPEQTPEKKKGVFERLSDRFRTPDHSESAAHALEQKDKRKALAELQVLSLGELEALLQKYKQPAEKKSPDNPTPEDKQESAKPATEVVAAEPEVPQEVFNQDKYEDALHDVLMDFPEHALELEAILSSAGTAEDRSASIADFNAENGSDQIADASPTNTAAEILLPDGKKFRVQEYAQTAEDGTDTTYVQITEVTPTVAPTSESKEAEPLPVTEAEQQILNDKIAEASENIPAEQELIEQAYARKIVEEAGKGTEITEEQIAFLVKDHLRRGARSAASELAFQKNGYKNVDQAMRKLEIEDGRTKGGQILIQEQSKMDEILSHVPPGMRRFGGNLLKAGVAGGATAAIFSLFFPPASLAIIAGTAIGSATGKTVFGEMGRFFGYRGKDGAPDKRQAAFNEIVGNIEEARRLAATSEEGKREVLGKIMQLMLSEDMKANKALADTDTKIRKAEGWGGVLGGIAGGAAGGYLDYLNAKANGVFMKGADIVTSQAPGPENGHYVKWAFDGKEWAWRYIPTVEDAQNYADSVAGGSTKIASIFGPGQTGIERMSPETLSYFNEAHHLGKHAGPAWDIFYRTLSTVGVYTAVDLGIGAASRHLDALGIKKKNVNALKAAQGLGGDTFAIPEKKDEAVKDAEQKDEQSAATTASAAAEQVAGLPREIVHEHDPEFWYQPGMSVTVKRSSGEMEDDWVIDKVNKTDSVAEVRKYTGNTVDGKEEVLVEVIALSDLDGWNNWGKKRETQVIEAQNALEAASESAPTKPDSPEVSTEDTPTKPELTPEPTPDLRFDHLSEQQVKTIENSVTRLVMNSGDLGKAKVFVLTEGGELNDVAKNTPRNIASLLGFSDSRFTREELLLELPEALQCALEKVGQLSGQSLDQNQRDRVNALSFSLGKLRDQVVAEESFAPTVASVRDHILYAKKMPILREQLTTIANREESESMDSEELGSLMGWRAYKEAGLNLSDAKKEMRDIRTLKKVITMHAQQYDDASSEKSRLMRELVTLGTIEAALKGNYTSIR